MLSPKLVGKRAKMHELLIFFGVRSYRDTVSGGAIPFGRAFLVGALIAFVASACYVVTWQVIYYRLAPDFGDMRFIGASFSVRMRTAPSVRE